MWPPIQCMYKINTQISMDIDSNVHKKFHRENTWIRLLCFCSKVLPKVPPTIRSKGWIILHYPSLIWHISLQLFIIQSSGTLKHLIRCTIFHQLFFIFFLLNRTNMSISCHLLLLKFSEMKKNRITSTMLST